LRPMACRRSMTTGCCSAAWSAASRSSRKPCAHLPDELLAQRPDMPWAEIRGIGNRIRHVYHRVSPKVIKSVVTDDLPALKNAIEAVRRSLSG
jgi:hypothetical protein